MRRTIAMLGAVGLLTIIPATPALGEGTIVFNDAICYGFVPTEDGQFDPDAILTNGRIHVVAKAGWTTLTCHLDIPPDLLPTTVRRADGVLCYTPLGYTNDTRMQASPGGRAVGTCRVRT